MINWNETNALFDAGSTSFIKRNKIPHFVDDEINGKFKKRDLKSLFKIMDDFVPTQASIEFTTVTVSCDEVKAEVRTYTNDQAKMQTWSTKNDDFAIVFEQGKYFLIVGNSGCHPFVYTNKFLFFNSDGSTEPDANTNNIMNTKIALKKLAIDYVFNQQH